MYLKILLVCSLFCLAIGFSGCSNDDWVFQKSDELTPAEQEALITYVRGFLNNNKKLKLTPDEKRIIMTTKPVIHLIYSGPKRGRLTLRWNISDGRLLILQRSGNLLSNEKGDWRLRLIKDNTVKNIPANFFGAHGEDISLPQH